LNKLNVGKDLYLKGRIGWRGLAKEEYLKNSNYRIINGTALEDKCINWNKCGYITQSRYEESPEIMLQEKDILISKDGTLGKIGYVEDVSIPSTVASGIFVMRNITPKKLDSDYLYHFLKSNIFKNFINRMKASGSTINHLYQRDLSQLELDLPSLKTQQKIANVLSTIDAKIELNNKMNKELEDMAKLIYDYWFVQFDFPNKKGKPYKSSGGKMVYNEKLKREIPEGWEVKKLEDVATVKKGTLITKKQANEKGKVKVVSAGINFSYYHDTPNNKEFTITVSASGANAGYINFWKEPIFANDCTTIYNDKLGMTIMILFYLQIHQEYLFNQTKGSAQPHVYPKDIQNIWIPLPSLELINQFHLKEEKLFNKKRIITRENQQLTELRDWLLPMLMNGQVTIA